MIHFADEFAAPPSELEVSESDAEGSAAAQPRVLVVDDERLLADTTAVILRRAGFQAKTAYDGFGALEMAESFRPDYLLTDIMMPAMNGVELAIAIMRTYPATKVLLISGQAGISDILADSRARGFEFPLLAKPAHPAKVVEALRDLKNK
ncbi:MAG TPA: response regulator [Acidobacteriaceae bacterium]|jgi:CheY-like chemotaxis protein|nr:response regulator [Acidobacteriaceae bacterium]